MSVDATDARSAANAHAADHQDDVRTPPLSPSVSASAAAAANGGSQFWCHECDANVATRVDEATDEVCCQRCGGNFVEEVEADDPPEVFRGNVAQPAAAAGATAASAPSPATVSASAVANAHVEDEVNEEREFFERYINDIRGEIGGLRRRGGIPRQQTTGGAFSDSLVHLLGGTPGVGGARSARIISSDGTPLEVFIGGANAGGGGDTGGLFGALGGMFNSPFASNPGDYAFGNLSNIINQLMQNDPNRHGAPPAAKDVVETLPKVKITQSDVDASAECPVCKDLFVVDDESHKLPCAHSFHIDCILPWLKQHNSCPVCRHELPTDDPDYERRRQSSVSE
ncbi:hypothetical protein Gpo141_00003137 [Globisporangium polare]